LDEKKRALKNEWKQREHAAAQAAFPLPDPVLSQFFSAVEAAVATAGCDHTRSVSEKWLADGGHDLAAVLPWLDATGGYCDCEVAANTKDHWLEHRAPTLH
jgi:hypothetical protein